MARIVFISNYLKGGRDAARLKNRVRYFATREGVELLKNENSTLPATQKQQDYILRLTRSFPEAKELLEYEDYLAAPTMGSAAEFIEQVQEQFLDLLDERENHIDYIAHRPGVQQFGEHGLWDANGKVQNLSAAVDEVAHYPGNVWTPIVALRREDAERLGYDNAENWRALVNASICDIAKGYKIPVDHLRWYAAFHEKEKQVHIHMVVFSADSKEGYLTKQGIQELKSAFAKQIYRQDMISVYERQTEYRNTLQQDAEARMAELISQMSQGGLRSEKIEQLTAELSERLKSTSGKKVYGYLPPAVKRIVDEIVDELARDDRVAAAYALWQEMRDEVCRTYDQTPQERLPLSAQKEFKPVRNMVIREALKLSEVTIVLENTAPADTPKKAENDVAQEPLQTAEENHTIHANESSSDALAPDHAALGNTVLRMLRHMGNIFRDNSTADSIHAGMQIDKKLRRKIKQKKIAMGHEADDHEQEQKYIMKQ